MANDLNVTDGAGYRRCRSPATAVADRRCRSPATAVADRRCRSPATAAADSPAAPLPVIAMHVRPDIVLILPVLL